MDGPIYREALKRVIGAGAAPATTDPFTGDVKPWIDLELACAADPPASSLVDESYDDEEDVRVAVGA